MSDHLERIAHVRSVLSGRSGDQPFDRVHPEVISLANGDGTRRPHENTIEAAVCAILDSDSYSFDNYHFQEVHRLFAQAARHDLTQIGVSSKQTGNLLVDFGSSSIITGIFQCLLSPQDIVLSAPAFYHGLIEWCNVSGVDLAVIGRGEPGAPRHSAHIIREWFETADPETRRRTRAIFFPNPTFTGHVYSHEELREIAQTIGEFGLIAVCDMVFSGVEYGDRHALSLAVFRDISDRVITVRSVSKAHNLANIRVGWAGGSADFITRLEDYREVTKGSVPFLCQSIAAAALTAPETYGRDNAEECQRRANSIIHWVEALNLRVRRHSGIDTCLRPLGIPQAGHSILLDASPLQGMETPDGMRLETSVDLCEFFLQHHRVCISPGYSMGFDGMEFRLAYGSVGLNQSYSASRKAELAAALRGAGHKTDREAQQITPFVGGSRLLRQACNRMEQAIDAILKHNQLAEQSNVNELAS